ncbi:hypothetical protein [Nocardia arthritidis]|uniref:Uncharacterized protein n=1 Tax=Nocardia arthritidis TaxID=228602 RepID=A0A6G9YPK6_9NOCA|nr:hypothetical protein [Nocardia arthritidis]QIS14956.1 hypothetical protein F5544_35630 [Nocardia arthritidis]
MSATNGVLAEGIYHITFDWPVFFSQLFAFGVIVYFLMWAFRKWMTPLMKKSQDVIAQQLEESKLASSRLAEAKQAYDNALAEAQRELERMRQDAQEDAVLIVAQMREVAAAEVARVRRQGRDQIVLFRKQVIRDLQAGLTATVLAQTEAKVRDQADSPQVRADSIERFLEDLETVANTPSIVRRRTQSQWN